MPVSSPHSAPDFRVRRYEPADLAALYDICLRTTASGGDGTHLYLTDPRALGNFYAAPYPAFDPSLTFVLANDDGVAGYVLGTSDTDAYNRWLDRVWLPPLRAAHPDPAGDSSSLTPTERIYRRFHHPDLKLPAALQTFPAHLHINLLPRAQGGGNGTRLMQRFLTELGSRNCPGVYLGLGVRNDHAFRFYQRVGFKELFRVGEPAHSIWMGLKLASTDAATPSLQHRSSDYT